MSLEVTEERTWTAAESALFGDPRLDNFAHFAGHSTERTVLSLAKVRRDGELVGVAPLTRLMKYRGTRLLEQRSRRWLDPLVGPFAKRTTCMIDASFMAFRYADPFFAGDAEDATAVRQAVVDHLKERRDVDNLMISEPAGDPSWLRANGFRTFLQLPLVRVDVAGCRTFDDYLAGLGHKRRANLRKDRKLFEAAGARTEVVAPPLDEELARALHACLLSSSRKNRDAIEIPFEDLMNSEPAFLTQRQWVIVCRVGSAIAGFFAFLPHDGTICQCHGGLDYAHSLQIKAYPNLIRAAVEYAIDNGYRQVTLGPLNNEAKRRAGELAPVMAGFWCRDALSRLLMDRLLLPRFQIYRGEID